MKSMIQNVSRSRTAQNAATIYAVQLVSYIFPLLTMPLVARLLGPTALGNFGYVLQISALMTIVIDYGFIVSAVRKTARNQFNSQFLSALASEVLCSKAAIAVTLLAAIFAFSWLTPAGIKREWILLAWLLSISQAFGLFWLFQGLEKMRIPGILDLLTKTLTFFGIYILSKSSITVSIVLLCYIFSGFFSLFFSYWFSVKYLGIKFNLVTLKEVVVQLKNGWNLLIMKLISSNLPLLSGILLTWLVSRDTVGQYFAADRLIRAGLAFVWPISVVMIPRLSRMADESQSILKINQLNTAFLRYGGFIGFFVFSIAVFVAEPLFNILGFGPKYIHSVPIFRVLAFLIPFNFFANVICQQWLVPLGLDNDLIIVYLLSVIVLCVGIFIFVPILSAIGMAISVVLAELTIFLAGLAVLRIRNKI